MKSYVIKIEADNVRHTHLIFSEDDLEILKLVLKKIETDASKVVEENK